MAHSVRAAIAISSAICLWLAAILQTLQAFNATGGESPQWDQNFGSAMRSLNATVLRTYWGYKRSQLGVDVTIDLLAALGLAGLAYCVIILKRIFKRYKNGMSDLPAFMAASFFIGAILPAIEFLQSLGITTAADIISQIQELPDVGIQIVQVAYNISRGSTLYMFSAQFICVSCGIFISSYLTFATLELPKKHAVLGFITAAIGFLTFIFEIATFNASAVGPGFGILVLLYGVILLPIWTIWLGIELRKIKEAQKKDANSNLDQNLVQMKSLDLNSE